MIDQRRGFTSAKQRPKPRIHVLRAKASGILAFALFIFNPGFAGSQEKFESFSIGKSKLGETIRVFRFGNGRRKILALGGIHGDETSAVRLCWDMVFYFKKHLTKIPKNVKLIIIPLLNPDGYFFHTRVNAAGVDINRNFPTKNWQKKIYILRATLPDGGGPGRSSERETRALIKFIEKEKPYLNIAYHSRAGFIYPEMDDPIGIYYSRAYERASGIKVLLIDWSKTYYKVTGSFAQWLIREEGLHTFTIESKDKYKISDNEIKANIKGLIYVMQKLSKKELLK